jgi:serine/threonine-protein kinase
MHDATVFCWGANDASQLADGTTTHRATPALIGGIVEVTDIAAGADATCIRFPKGEERCWGSLLLPKSEVTRITVPMEVRF